MMGRRIIYMLFTLLFLHAETALSQLGFDVATLEAYIADHKTQRSLLLARSTLEQSNKLLHDYSQVANKEYKEINVELDKYSRAFDIIDIQIHISYCLKIFFFANIQQISIKQQLVLLIFYKICQ